MSDQIEKIDDLKPAKAVSLSAWKKAAVHTVTLPSSAVVDIKIPDLPAIVEAGNFPQHLLSAALGAAAATNKQKEPTVEDIIEQREFTDTLVRLTVVSPKLSEGDMLEIPFEDKEMIVEFAMRVRDIDALFNHIGGLDQAGRFRALREGLGGDSDVEGP